MTQPNPSVVPLHPNADLAELASRAKSRQQGIIPGNGDKVGYWLMPPDVFTPINAEFKFDFDACPYPRPAGFDGREVPWGRSTWVNPPFLGPGAARTPWVRKMLEERSKGNTSVMINFMDKWAADLIKAGAEVRVLEPFRFMNPDGKLAKKPYGRYAMVLFVVDAKKRECETCHGTGKVPK